MAIDKFSDVIVCKDCDGELTGCLSPNHREFRIGRVTAEVGSWIMTEMSAGTIHEPEVYRKITYHLFNLVSVYQNMADGSKSPMRVYQDGKFLVPELDLEYDLETFQMLYKKAMDYNFAPFLAKLKKQKEEDEKNS